MYNEQIDKQIANAMKNGEHLKLSVWRSIKTEFVKFKTSGSNEELTYEKEMQILSKMVQQRKDSIAEYKKADRNELADAEEQEMNIILTLLPSEPTEEDIENEIKNFISQKEEKVTMKNMRDIMTHVKSKYPTVNGGIVSKLFREKYI